MKKVTSLCIVGLLSLVAGSAFGALTITTGDTVEIDGWGPGNGGGPFTLTDITNAQGSEQVFCVEAGQAVEYFSPGSHYYALPSSATFATASGNAVTPQAKWIYYTYMTDPASLSGYSEPTATFQEDVQEAIWAGVIAGPNATNGLASQPLAAPAGTGIPGQEYESPNAVLIYNQAPAVWTPPAGVYVNILNPYGDPTYTSGPQDQSQLYLSSSAPEQTVPEPISLIVWSALGAGAAGMAFRRRRSGARWSAQNRQAIHAMIESKLHS